MGRRAPFVDGVRRGRRRRPPAPGSPSGATASCTWPSCTRTPAPAIMQRRPVRTSSRRAVELGVRRSTVAAEPEAPAAAGVVSERRRAAASRLIADDGGLFVASSIASVVVRFNFARWWEWRGAAVAGAPLHPRLDRLGNDGIRVTDFPGSPPPASVAGASPSLPELSDGRPASEPAAAADPPPPPPTRPTTRRRCRRGVASPRRSNAAGRGPGESRAPDAWNARTASPPPLAPVWLARQICRVFGNLPPAFHFRTFSRREIHRRGDLSSVRNSSLSAPKRGLASASIHCMLTC